jgi:hypothetical protein
MYNSPKRIDAGTSKSRRLVLELVSRWPELGVDDLWREEDDLDRDERRFWGSVLLGFVRN